MAVRKKFTNIDELNVLSGFKNKKQKKKQFFT